MKFDKVYALILEDIKDLYNAVTIDDDELEEIANDFIMQTTDEYAEDFDSLNAFLHEQLSKIIPKSKYLEGVDFDFIFDGSLSDDDMIAMCVWPNDLKTICINVLPFIKIRYIDKNESISDALEPYLYHPETGEHLIQHECAHIIDLALKGKKARYNGQWEHDAAFRRIQKQLDETGERMDKKK